MSDKKVPSYLDVIISNYDELQSLKVEIERLRAAGALDAVGLFPEDGNDE